jgi:hypothetical protein
VRIENQISTMFIHDALVGVKWKCTRGWRCKQELPLRTYEHFASRGQLSRMVLERMLAGVSTRR